MKKALLLLAVAALTGCSKGSDSPQGPAPVVPAGPVAAIATTYDAALCSQFYNGYAQQYANVPSGWNPQRAILCSRNSFQNRPRSDDTVFGGISQYVNSGIPYGQTGISFSFRLTFGARFGDNEYWNLGRGYGNNGYYNGQYCTYEQARDFYQTVALGCGFGGWNSGMGWNSNMAFYSTDCKNRLIDFRNRNPNINCAYMSEYSNQLYGILDDNYLVHNICTLSQCGL